MTMAGFASDIGTVLTGQYLSTNLTGNSAIKAGKTGQGVNR